MVRIKRVVLLMVILVSPVLMGLFLLWGIDKTAHAVSTNTLTVTNVYDSGIGSLRQAIQDSNDGDTIIFNTNGIIELNQELVVDKSLSNQGNRQITISGGGQVRVFHVMTRTNSQNVAVTLDRLSIVDGKFIIESPDMIDFKSDLAPKNLTRAASSSSLVWDCSMAARPSSLIEEILLSCSLRLTLISLAFSRRIDTPQAYVLEIQ